MRSAEEAAAFFETLRQMLVWLGVNDGNMDEGSLRCDANVSVRPHGRETLGTKAEVKNVNSFRYLQKAIEYEIGRQIDVIEHGGTSRAGDAAVRRRAGQDLLDAQQGRGARLPVLPGARSAARWWSTPPAATRCRRSCRSCPRRGAAASSSSTRCPPTMRRC